MGRALRLEKGLETVDAFIETLQGLANQGLELPKIHRIEG
jgi:hypothetical protein